MKTHGMLEEKLELHICMLLAGWEVRIGKNYDRGLENAAGGRRLRRHNQARGHSFSLYGPTLSRTITCLSFFLALTGFNKLKYKNLCLPNFVIELVLRRLQTIRKKKPANERVFAGQRKMF